MTLDQLQHQLQAVPLRRLAEIATAAGVPYGTALKIRGGYTKNPRIRTVEALCSQFPEQARAAE